MIKVIKQIVPIGFFTLKDRYMRKKQLKNFYKQFERSEYRKLLQPNEKFKDENNGKRAFVIATGPSIKEQELSALKGEDCFTVSNAFLHEQINLIDPKFHFFAPYHKPLVEENFAEWLESANKTLPKETKMFLSVTDKQIVEKYNLFKGRDMSYLYFDANVPYSNMDFDITKPLSPFLTGPQMIFPVLYYMGYSEIYLLGCDQNTLKDYGGTISNFYSKKDDKRVNATNEGCWKDIRAHLEVNLKAFELYTMNYNFCKMRNIKIYNTSPSSWIPDIPFKSLDLINT